MSDYKIDQFSAHGYAIKVVRQSGFIERFYHAPTIESAISQVYSNARRSPRFHTLRVSRDTASELFFSMNYDPSGKSKGKKIQRYEVHAIDVPFNEFIRRSNNAAAMGQVGLFSLVLFIMFLIALSSGA
ncbi:hypothetical protein ABXV18_27075 [Vibrio owensii]|uniref:hypothetical protein n=1 Tax=Vibrio owensii TaxID=696485 RepID=UPI0033993E7E